MKQKILVSGIRRLALCIFALGAGGVTAEVRADAVPPWQFEVSVPAGASAMPLTGRLIIAIAKEATPEPRETVGMNGPVLIGADMEHLKPGAAMVVDATAVSFPYASLYELPPGDYALQAILIRYSEVKRSDGHVLWVPTAHRRVPFTKLPGNLYSKVQAIHLDPGQRTSARLELSEVIPPLPALKDSEYLRHVTLQSKLNSRLPDGKVALLRFWDPRVFVPLFNALDTAGRQAYFGDVTEWHGLKNGKRFHVSHYA